MHIPKGASWYLAEVVESINVEDERTNLVHINLVLISASSPDEAFEKARKWGAAAEDSYRNPENKNVNVKYEGLRNLYVIYEDLVDGAELLYEERIGLTRSEIEGLVVAKENLAVFRDNETVHRPDFRCKEVIEEAARIVENQQL